MRRITPPVSLFCSRLASPLAVSIALLIASPASAKLPALGDEAKAKAAEAAAKSAWADKVGAFQLCRSMDRVAEAYRAHAKAAGQAAPAPTETPACTDPGAYVAAAAPAAAPPLEAAGAHSPATTATAPPSSNATHAEIQGKSKK